jgi:hypothetical protein
MHFGLPHGQNPKEGKAVRLERHLILPELQLIRITGNGQDKWEQTSTLHPYFSWQKSFVMRRREEKPRNLLPVCSQGAYCPGFSSFLVNGIM